ncbi:MAG: oligosaccharide flippase family protein [Flavobacteriales bacterium]
MGIVKQQAFQNSVFNYLGQAIGYVNIALLFPILLTPDEFGLTRLMASASLLFAQLSSFGSQRVIIKFFPSFKGPKGSDNGFLTLVSLLVLIAFGVTLVLFYLLEDWIIETQGDPLFTRYVFIIPWLGFLNIIYWVLESYLRAQYKTSLTSFVNNVLLKILWLSSAIAYYYGFLDLDAFVVVYSTAYLPAILILVIYLVRQGQLKFRINALYYRWRMLKHIVRYGAYSILDDTNTVMMNNIDKLMIGFMMDLKSVAIYTVASYLSTAISIPSASMNRIVVPLLATHWKRKEWGKVEQLYKQSTSINLVVAGSLFVLVWSNINELLTFLDEEYISGVTIILFLMLTRVVDLAFGLNGDIILVSKNYWFNTLSGLILVILMVIFNWIFIPLYGFVGAAFGTLLSKIVFNVIKYLFLKLNDGLDPFTIQNFKGFIILTIAFWAGEMIKLDNLGVILSIAVKSLIIGSFMALMFYYFNISEDINVVVDKQVKKIRKLILNRG